MATFTARLKRTITSDVQIEAPNIEGARKLLKKAAGRGNNGPLGSTLFDMWHDNGVDVSDNIKVAHVKAKGGSNGR